MTRNQKVKWVNPETGRTYYHSQIPLPVLQQLVSETEYQKEKARRNQKYNSERAAKYYQKNKERIRKRQMNYYNTKIKPVIKGEKEHEN